MRRLLVMTLTTAAIAGAPSPAGASGGASTSLAVLPVGSQVAGLAVGAHAVWVANGRPRTVSRLDPSTNQVLATIRLAETSPTCERCWGAVAARGDAVWVAMDAAGPLVARIEAASNAIAETVDIGCRLHLRWMRTERCGWRPPSENVVVRIWTHASQGRFADSRPLALRHRD
jgi:hypothetical protein